MNYCISVIVPIYNVEQYLDRCVISIVNQTYKNLEIILVDDGSTDNCPTLCDEWEKKDERIKVIHKKNGGLSDARNNGLKSAKGEYILYIDSDDYIDLDSCERFIKATLGQNIDIIVGNAIVEKNNSLEMMIHDEIQFGVIYTAKDFIEKSIKQCQWYAPAWLNMYRREFLLKNDLFFKRNRYFEDVQILPRVFLSAKKITCIKGTFYHYVIRENSIMTSNKNPKKSQDIIQNLTEWKLFYDQVQDTELQKYLYGMLIKMYLHECRLFGIQNWEIDGVDFSFSLKYSLSFKERLKVVFFQLLPNIYIRINVK